MSTNDSTGTTPDRAGTRSSIAPGPSSCRWSFQTNAPRRTSRSTSNRVLAVRSQNATSRRLNEFLPLRRGPSPMYPRGARHPTPQGRGRLCPTRPCPRRAVRRGTKAPLERQSRRRREQPQFHILGDSPAALIVFAKSLDERLGATPQRRAVDVFASDRPVQNVTQELDRSIDRRRLQRARCLGVGLVFGLSIVEVAQKTRTCYWGKRSFRRNAAARGSPRRPISGWLRNVAARPGLSAASRSRASNARSLSPKSP